MKQTLVIIIASMMSFGAYAQMAMVIPSERVSTPAVGLKWESTTHDFGDIKSGSQATFEYEFTNHTNKPVVILDVTPSCGCTATGYSDLPVEPGISTSIRATFNSKSTGPFLKTVSVLTSANAKPVVLQLIGNVVD
jgi:hypothetical protein